MSDASLGGSQEGTCSIRSSAGRWVLTATLLASGASFIMWSAVAVALPSIQAHFDTTVAGIQWVVNSHLLTLSAFLLIGGSLGDHYGRRKLFVIGMSIFALGGILSGFAWSVALLISFQALQGVGSALMVPQSLAIINACFPSEERGRAIGLWAGISGGIAALGPWVGGWLVEYVGWPGVFWMTIPVIIFALGATIRFVPENRDVETARLDWRGTLLVFLGLLGIAYALISAPARGWTAPLILGSLSGGVGALVAFVLLERRIRDPLVSLQIFRNPLVSGANTVTLLLYFAFNGVVVFTVLNLQQIQGYSPTEAGLGMLPPIIIITFLAAPAGTLADRFGPRLQMIGGPALVAAGIALLMTGGTDARYMAHFLPGLVVTGIGMAFVIAPLTKSALLVETQLSGTASGVNNAIARTAALLAVAVLGAVMLAAFAPRLNELLQASQLGAQEQIEIMTQHDRLGGIVIPEGFDEQSRLAALRVVRESFIYAFRWAMGVCATLALLGSVVSFFTIREEKAHQCDYRQQEERG